MRSVRCSVSTIMRLHIWPRALAGASCGPRLGAQSLGQNVMPLLLSTCAATQRWQRPHVLCSEPTRDAQVFACSKPAGLSFPFPCSSKQLVGSDGGPGCSKGPELDCQKSDEIEGTCRAHVGHMTMSCKGCSSLKVDERGPRG